jgi:hypothetical protein
MIKLNRGRQSASWNWKHTRVSRPVRFILQHANASTSSLVPILMERSPLATLMSSLPPPLIRPFPSISTRCQMCVLLWSDLDTRGYPPSSTILLIRRRLRCSRRGWQSPPSQSGSTSSISYRGRSLAHRNFNASQIQALTQNSTGHSGPRLSALSASRRRRKPAGRRRPSRPAAFHRAAIQRAARSSRAAPTRSGAATLLVKARWKPSPPPRPPAPLFHAPLPF